MLDHSETDIVAYVGGFLLERTPSNGVNACYYETVNVDLSVWKISNPLLNNVPYFAVQLSITIFMIHLLFFIFRFTRQPRFFAELITACMLGPIFFRSSFFLRYVRPIKSNVVLQTMANLGLVYYMFLVGLEIDLNMVRRVGKKAFTNAVAGILFSMGMGASLYCLFTRDKSIFPSASPVGGLFWGVALTVTSFPDLAQVLSDINLISTDLGQMALSSAFVSDLASWTILIMTITWLHGRSKLSILPTVGFIILCWFVVRPVLSKIKSSSNKSSGRDFYVYVILAGVLICGFITDACGSTSMTGAFVLGLVTSNEFETRILEQVNNFVAGILLPSYVMVVGGKIDIVFLMSKTNVVTLLVIVVLAFSVKVLSSFLVCKAFGVSARDGIALGILMNTKGLLALVVINIGVDVQALDFATFPAMVIVFLVMTALVKPFPYWVSKSSKNLKQYKQRTMETSKDDSEFQIIMCVHESHHLSGMSTLLNLSNSTKLSPITIFALHLVELTGRSSAMLIVHDAYNATNISQPIFERVISDHVISQSLRSYGRRGTGHPISIQPVTVVSPYATMHREICCVAEDKHVTLIVVPFHKEGCGIDVVQENSSIRTVNHNLLAKAPCSVGIFVDRGLQLSIRDMGSNLWKQQINVAMLFTGGPDDREALAYSWRMAGSHEVRLTVVHFRPGEKAKNIMEERKESENYKQLDEKYVNELRFKAKFNDSVIFLEKVVNNGEEILRTTKEMFDYYDLYIVGRGQGVASPFTSGLSEWSDCKDLGVLGEALSTSEFARNASILVIQQYYVADTAE